MTHSENSEGNDHESNCNTDTCAPKNSWYNPLRIIRWHNSLGNIDRFTFWIAILTFFLVVMTGVQVLSYVESERAQILVDNVIVKDVDPFLLNPVDVILTIKNVGKHTAVITRVNFQIGFFIVNKDLPKYPDYAEKFNLQTVVAPVPPGGILAIFGTDPNKEFSVSKDAVIQGVNEGTIPLRVFGVIEYDTGYWTRSGTVGFCFIYIPPSKRFSNQNFDTCNDQRYTYVS